MTIENFKNEPINKAIAYILGLIFPFYIDRKEAIDKNKQKKYAVGSINHNKVSDEDLAEHFKSVCSLMRECHLEKSIIIKTNKKINSQDYSCSSKKGFSCLIETTNISKDIVEQILRDKVKQLRTESEEYRSYFVKGCFDGRSSWDTTLHCVSVDIDRKKEKASERKDQFLIKDICESVLGIGSIQINQRDASHPKNDQLRIRSKFVREFLSKVGLFSCARTQIILNGLNEARFCQINCVI